MQIKSIVSAAAIAALAAFAWAPIAQGKPFDTFVVDDDGMATPGDCDSDEDTFDTIQAAIDAASHATKLNKRDVILVCPGEYLENVIVDKTVILQGLGGAVAYAIVDAGDSGSNFTVDAYGVKIDNFKIINGGDDFIDNAGILVVEDSGGGNEFSHNWIVDQRDEGIDIMPGADANNVHHNTIDNSFRDGVDVAAVAMISTTTPYPDLTVMGFI